MMHLHKKLTNKTEEGKGGLSVDMIVPKLLCDVNHRIKAMEKPVFALAALSNHLYICKNVDVLRVKRNIGWYVRG